MRLDYTKAGRNELVFFAIRKKMFRIRHSLRLILLSKKNIIDFISRPKNTYHIFPFRNGILTET